MAWKSLRSWLVLRTSWVSAPIQGAWVLFPTPLADVCIVASAYLRSRICLAIWPIKAELGALDISQYRSGLLRGWAVFMAAAMSIASSLVAEYRADRLDKRRRTTAWLGCDEEAIKRAQPILFEFEKTKTPNASLKMPCISDSLRDATLTGFPKHVPPPTSPCPIFPPYV